MMNVQQLQLLKTKGEKFTAVTAYDATFSRLISEIGIEVQLVGDSLGNVIQGHDSTIPVTIADMLYHTRIVSRGNTKSLIIADLPFMSYANTDQALFNASQLMQAGAHMVKMEGGAWLSEIVVRLTERGIPVCGHLGLTPQSVHTLGGYQVQARSKAAADKLVEDANALQQAGAMLLVIECVPCTLAAELTKILTIPVIGIGAGNKTDGQILVLYDLLGLQSAYAPKFVKNFMAETTEGIVGALQAYHNAVKAGNFPELEHSF